MVSCQMEHQKSRLDKEPKEDLPVKEKCELPPEIKEIYTEVWKIHKECANPKTDDDWSYLIRQAMHLWLWQAQAIKGFTVRFPCIA